MTNKNPESDLNVLMVFRYFWPHIGGNENQGKLLAEALSENYNVSITILTSMFNNNLSSTESLGSLKIIRLPSLLQPLNLTRFSNKFVTKILFLLEEYSLQFSIYTYIRKNIAKYDIIHVHQTSWMALLPNYLCQKNDVPILVKEATYDGFRFLSRLFIPQTLKRSVVRNAYFVGISNNIVANLKGHGVPENKIFYIPNGVAFSDQCNNFSSKESHKRVLLFVGNYSHGAIKGLDILLRAVGIVKKSVPNVLLKIIGDGDRNIYNNLIYDLSLEENIEFIGKVSDPKAFYLNADIYILPSRSEGMSNSLLEAMSFGIPCIATRVSGVEDIIDNYINGIIVDIEDYKSLSVAILEILSNDELANKLKVNSRHKIKDKFDIISVANKYFSTYREIT